MLPTANFLTPTHDDLSVNKGQVRDHLRGKWSCARGSQHCIRLARNVKNHPFPGWAKVAEMRNIVPLQRSVARGAHPEDGCFFNIEDLTDTEKHILVERHLISRELSESSHSPESL